MSTPEAEIERDLSWRESEMGTLKLLLASAPSGSDRQRALMRACCAMVYAHYEGFCKFCWSLFLAHIEQGGFLRRDLAEPLARRAMVTVFRSLRGNLSDANLWRFAAADFHNELAEKATFPEEIDTESNLWPEVARKINDSVGVTCTFFNVHDASLRQLVGRRNKIAHGEKLEIADLTQLQQFETAATMAMHDLALAVVDCIEKKTYLRSSAGTQTVTANDASIGAPY